MLIKFWVMLLFINGYIIMRFIEVGRSLGNSSYLQMVKCMCEKGSKCIGECDGAITCCIFYGNIYYVLFGNKVFNMLFREFFFVVKGEGGVFCVFIQSNDMIIGFVKFNKVIGIGLMNSNL